jgi:hypothetical protein
MWALFAVGAGFVCGVFWLMVVLADGKKAGFAGLIAVVTGTGAIGCALIAVIRFVKWVWG